MANFNFWDRVSFSLGWSPVNFVGETVLEHPILLSLSPRCWDYICGLLLPPQVWINVAQQSSKNSWTDLTSRLALTARIVHTCPPTIETVEERAGRDPQNCKADAKVTFRAPLGWCQTERGTGLPLLYSEWVSWEVELVWVKSSRPLNATFDPNFRS